MNDNIVSNFEVAREMIQEIVDAWRSYSMPIAALADAFAEQAEHLRSGSDKPIVRTVGYLSDMPAAKAAYEADAEG